MTTSTDLEARRKRIETWAKVLGLGVAGLLFAPFAVATITGLISLIVVGVIGLLAVNVGVPWFAASLANWRLKALKAVAAANPIETLENRYAQLKDSLLKQRENIKQRIAIASKIFEQIKGYESSFKKPSPRRDQYEKLNQLVEVSKSKYSNAQVSLVAFGQLIDEKRSDWEIALSMAEANKLANVGEDFTAKLMQDTALTTISDGLNLAFAELDASVMDENIQKVLNGETATVTVAPAVAVPATARSSNRLTPPSDLDFDAHSTETEPVVVTSSRRTKAA